MARLGRSYPALLQRGKLVLAVLPASTTVVTVGTSADASVDRAISATLNVVANAVFPYALPITFSTATSVGVLNGFQANLAISATPTSGGNFVGRAGAPLDAVATATADLTGSYRNGAPFAVSVTASADVSRTANVSAVTASYVLPSIFGVNSAPASSATVIGVNPSAAGQLSAFAASSLDVSATTASTALETGRGEGSLAVSATPDAVGSANYPSSATLGATATSTADAHRTANVSSTLNAFMSAGSAFPFTFPVLLGYQSSDTLRDAKVAADLAVTGNVNITLSQSFVALFAIAAEGSGTGYLFAPVAGSPASAVASLTAAGTNNSKAQSATGIAAVTSSYVFKDAGVEAAQAIVCATSAEIQNSAVSGALLDAEAAFTAIAVENDAAASESQFAASPSADSDRLARANTSTAITASLTASALVEAFASSPTTSITAGITAVAAVPQRIDTLSDYFNNKDTFKWNFGADALVSDGVLRLPCGTSGGSFVESRYSASSGTPWYKFSDGCIVGALLSGTPIDGSTAFQLVEVGSGLGRIRITWQGGQWAFRQMDSAGQWGTQVNAIYPPTGSWTRLRRDSGIVLWETSEDGLNWTMQHSEALDSTYAGCSVMLSAEGGSVGVAEWDNFNIVPIPASAALSVTVSASGGSTTAKTAQAAFGISAGSDQVGSNDARAAGSLASYIDSSPQGMRIPNGLASLDISVGFTASAIEYNPADAAFDVTIDGSVVFSRAQDFGCSSGFTVEPDGAARRGRSVGSAIVPVTFSSTASAVNLSAAQSSLSVYANTVADTVKIQYLSAELLASFTSVADAVETVYITSSLQVAAAVASALSRHQPFTAALAATVSPFVTGNVILGISASLAITANASVEVEEPREMVAVPVDNRDSYVLAAGREAAVPADQRLAHVAAGDILTVAVAEDVRIVSAQDSAGRRSAVAATDRWADVPAEALTAQLQPI